MKHWLQYIALGVIVVIGLPSGLLWWASSGTLPSDHLLVLEQHSDAASPAPDTFSVMTYNVGYASGIANNVEPVADAITGENLEQIVTQIVKTSPDILAVQEIDFNSHRSAFVDQLLEIAVRGGFSYSSRAINWDKHYVPFPGTWPPTHFRQVVSGQAIFSQRPLIEQHRHMLTRRPQVWWRDAFYLDRLAHVTIVDMGKPVAIMNVHLEHEDVPTRQQQLEEVMTLYEQYSAQYPTIVLGDFNAVPIEADIIYDVDTSLENFVTQTGLTEAFFGKENTLTYRADTPDRKLDHIFYDPREFVLIDAHVDVTDTPPPSDHRALVATFRHIKTPGL